MRSPVGIVGSGCGCDPARTDAVMDTAGGRVPVVDTDWVVGRCLYAQTVARVDPSLTKIR